MKKNFKKLHSNYDVTQERKLIFSLKLCEFLLKKGHKIIAFEKARNSDRLIFVFENTNDLHYSMDEFMKQIRDR